MLFKSATIAINKTMTPLGYWQSTISPTVDQLSSTRLFSFDCAFTTFQIARLIPTVIALHFTYYSLSLTLFDVAADQSNKSIYAMARANVVVNNCVHAELW